MYATNAIEHHASVIEEIDRMTKNEIEKSLPRMNQISVMKIKGNVPHMYDLTKVKGEILLRVLCNDGLVLVIRGE